MPDADNAFHTGLVHRGDGAALGRYIETYGYDPAGNILEMRHRGSDPAHPGWVRSYNYNETSRIEPDRAGNRLSSTQVSDIDVERYAYDAHGSMTAMPHLPLMQWTWLDQLQASARQVVGEGLPETTYYVYDGSGQRVRKVTERRASANGQAVRTREHIYLGGFEIYRELGPDGAAIALERETLHVLDVQQRLALVETKTVDASAALPLPSPLIRYQLGNHLGSSSLELDDDARVISYQEYLPFGSTSYQAYDSLVEAPAKRYQVLGQGARRRDRPLLPRGAILRGLAGALDRL